MSIHSLENPQEKAKAVVLIMKNVLDLMEENEEIKTLEDVERRMTESYKSKADDVIHFVDMVLKHGADEDEAELWDIMWLAFERMIIYTDTSIREASDIEEAQVASEAMSTIIGPLCQAMQKNRTNDAFIILNRIKVTVEGMHNSSLKTSMQVVKHYFPIIEEKGQAAIFDIIKDVIDDIEKEKRHGATNA